MKTNPDSRPIIEIGEANFESEVLRCGAGGFAAFGGRQAHDFALTSVSYGQPTFYSPITKQTNQQIMKTHKIQNTQNLIDSRMKRFNNRTVIVTGGARGMGASHARGFIAEGANVVIADVLEQEGRTLADELGDQAIFSRLDVTSDADWAATVGAAEDTFGPVSVLINNAGIVRFGVIAETELAAWRQVIDINLTGTYLGTRAVVPSMRKAGGGAIVNISSTEGMRGNFGIGAYVASKWGARGLTKTAALEIGRDNIRVNSIHPGVIRTPIIAGPAAAAFEALASDAVTPHVGQPHESTRTG